MLKEVAAKEILSTLGQKTEKLVIILATSANSPMPVKDIKNVGIRLGVQGIKSWNVGAFLGKSNFTRKVPEGWELTKEGRDQVSILAKDFSPMAISAITDLRETLKQISDQQCQNYLDEAVKCFEVKLLRASVVMSWVGAVYLLHSYVVNNKLKEFNNEAKRRDGKWKNAKTTDDLGRMKEHEFLNVLETISVIGKNVKQELQDQCLKLRNACGHPNSFDIGELTVARHLEILIINVFKKFA